MKEEEVSIERYGIARADRKHKNSGECLHTVYTTGRLSRRPLNTSMSLVTLFTLSSFVLS